jgi:hypothetical protein
MLRNSRETKSALPPPSSTFQIRYFVSNMLRTVAPSAFISNSAGGMQAGLYAVAG